MTKTLYLVRHAKSGWTDMHLGDFSRTLNQRGRHDAPEMGKRLQKRGVRPEIILCSPAQRTRQTAELLVKEFGGTMDGVQFEDRIYEADPGTLLDLIQSLPETCASAMVIGHNPSIGYLAHQLSDVPIEQMPACAVATIEWEAQGWSDVTDCTSRLIDFDYPTPPAKG